MGLHTNPAWFSTAPVSGATSGRPAIASLREATRSFERAYVLATLRRHGGRIAPAAEELGLRVTNLYRKLRQLGIRFSNGVAEEAAGQAPR